MWGCNVRKPQIAIRLKISVSISEGIMCGAKKKLPSFSLS